MKKLLEYVVTTVVLFAGIMLLASLNTVYAEAMMDVLWYMGLDQYVIIIMLAASAVMACVATTLGAIVENLVYDVWKLIKMIYHKIGKAA